MRPLCRGARHGSAGVVAAPLKWVLVGVDRPHESEKEIEINELSSRGGAVTSIVF